MQEVRAMYGGGRLRIDLGAIVQNYRLLARRIAPAQLGAVVKANAYGLGATQVATALVNAGCQLFFVAHIDEALQLQSSVPAKIRIVVLNGLPLGAERLCAEAHIIPVLNSLDQAQRWRETAAAIGRRLPAVLQFDSGMARLGLAHHEATLLATDESFGRLVKLEMVMSHLACADIKAHSANAMQFDRFTCMAAAFPGTIRSISNSGGAFLAPVFHCGIVRAGIALYGGEPNDIATKALHRVISLDARVIQVRTVPAGSRIGYGQAFCCSSAKTIATIGVGYADGLLRSLVDRGAAWFDSTRLPMVGRISMDSIMLDVTALPPGRLRNGDWVELIGPNQSIDQLARDAGTISYEILTSLGARHDRSYINAETASKAKAA